MENKLEQLFYFAVGSALAAKDKMEQNSSDFKSYQEKAEQTARSFFDDCAQRGEEEKQSVKTQIKELLEEVIDELGLATKEDLAELKKELGR